MSVVLKKKGELSRFRYGKRQIVPIISLKCPEKKELAKNKYVVLKCRSDPKKRQIDLWLASSLFLDRITRRVFEVTWQRRKGHEGLWVYWRAKKSAFTRRLLEGDALTVFNLKASEIGTETIAT